MKIFHIVLTPIFILFSFKASADFYIDFVPVGAGSCQVISCPTSKKSILVDCGSTGSGTQQWNKQTVVSHVKGQIPNGDQVFAVASHPDTDHVSYLPAILDGLSVKSVHYGGDIQDYPPEFQQWASLENTHGTKFISLPENFYSDKANADLSCPKDGMSAYIVAANAGERANDKSIVVALVSGNFTALITGDMTMGGHNVIQANRKTSSLDLSSISVLVMPHHGASPSSNSDEQCNHESWGEAYSPATLIASAGTRYGHPRCDALDTYKDYLADFSSHRAACGTSNNTCRKFNTDKAFFVTDVSGGIVVNVRRSGSYTIADE